MKPRRGLATTMLALSLATGTLTALSAPAEAASGCATRAEFKKVKMGMGLKKVRHIFGSQGHELFNDNGESGYYWNTCIKHDDNVARVAFEDGKGLIQKDWGPVR
jgi:hypothetical protein